jgi:hypothetical protein
VFLFVVLYWYVCAYRSFVYGAVSLLLLTWCCHRRQQPKLVAHKIQLNKLILSTFERISYLLMCRIVVIDGQIYTVETYTTGCKIYEWRKLCAKFFSVTFARNIPSLL